MQSNVRDQIMKCLIGRVRMCGKIGIDGLLHREQVASSTAQEVIFLKFWYRLTVGCQLLKYEALIGSETSEVGCRVQFV